MRLVINTNPVQIAQNTRDKLQRDQKLDLAFMKERQRIPNTRIIRCVRLQIPDNPRQFSARPVNSRRIIRDIVNISAKAVEPCGTHRIFLDQEKPRPIKTLALRRKQLVGSLILIFTRTRHDCPSAKAFSSSGNKVSSKGRTKGEGALRVHRSPLEHHLRSNSLIPN